MVITRIAIASLLFRFLLSDLL